jgi:hypothetical protein
MQSPHQTNALAFTTTFQSNGLEAGSCGKPLPVSPVAVKREPAPQKSGAGFSSLYCRDLRKFQCALHLVAAAAGRRHAWYLNCEM